MHNNIAPDEYNTSITIEKPVKYMKLRVYILGMMHRLGRVCITRVQQSSTSFIHILPSPRFSSSFSQLYAILKSDEYLE